MQLTDILIDRHPADGFVKRLFWPRIASQRDVDLVGQQGFWICAFVAAVWMVGGMFTQRPYLDAVIGLTYLMAAMGIRQHSVPAAVLAFAGLFLDRLAALEAMLLDVPGGGNPRVGLVAILLLFLNIRATLLAHRWQAEMSETGASLSATSLRDRFANRWPPFAWPRVRHVFYALAGLVILTSVVALFSLPSMYREQLSQGPAVIEPTASQR